MMQVSLVVDGGFPELPIDHIDVAAPPPPGTVVELLGLRYLVHELTLVIEVHRITNYEYTAHYAARLVPADV